MERSASHASMGPSTPPTSVRHSSIFCSSSRSRRGDVAQQDVAVAGHGLGVGGDGEVRAERERTLAERGRGGVVDGHQRAGAVRAFAQRDDVADLHGRVAGRLDPEQPRAFQVIALRVIGGGREAHDDAHVARSRPASDWRAAK